MAGNVCDVCERSPVIGVASSALVPMSFAFCQECIQHNAEPLIVFIHLFDDVSNNGDGLIDEMVNFSTWREGKYLTWLEYRAERRNEKVPV